MRRIILILLLLSIQISAKPRKFIATMYSLKGKTRSGENVRHGIIAADWKVLPEGTKVKLYHSGKTGIYVVKDTGKKIKGNRIDIWTNSARNAVKFGKKEVFLEVIR